MVENVGRETESSTFIHWLAIKGDCASGFKECAMQF